MGNSAINPLALMLGATGMGQQLPAFLIEQIRRSQEATMPPEARPQEMGGTAVGPREPSELELLLLAQAGGGTPSMYGAPSQTEAASTGARVAAALGPAGQAQALGRSSVLPTMAAMEQMRNAQAAQSMAAQKARAGAPMAAAKLSREQAETEKVRALAGKYQAEAEAEPRKVENDLEKIRLMGELRILREQGLAVDRERQAAADERDRVRLGIEQVNLLGKHADLLTKFTKLSQTMTDEKMLEQELNSAIAAYKALPQDLQKSNRRIVEGPFRAYMERIVKRLKEGGVPIEPKGSRTGKLISNAVSEFMNQIDASLAEGASKLLNQEAAPEELPTPTGEETPVVGQPQSSALPPFQQMIESYRNR